MPDIICENPLLSKEAYVDDHWCIFCGNDDSSLNFNLDSLSHKAKLHDNETVTHIKKFIHETFPTHITSSQSVCIRCFYCVEQIKDLKGKAQQLQNILIKRSEERKVTKPQRSMTSVIQSKVDLLKRTKSGTCTLDAFPGLSISMIHAPIPKKRSYGKGYNEYVKASKYFKGHNCGISKSCIITEKKTDANGTWNYSKKENVNNIICKVKDLDKSFLNFKPSNPLNNFTTPNNKTNEENIEGSCNLNEQQQLIYKAPDAESGTPKYQCVNVRNSNKPNINLTPAQHLLLNNSLASSLLSNFLSTSLWMDGNGGPEAAEHVEEVDAEKEDDEEEDAVEDFQTCPEDVTSESLAAPPKQDKNTRQELKNTGQSYMNTKGKMVEAKRVTPQDCSKCAMRCSAKLSESDRQSVFAEFWGLADYNKQREYLAGHMVREEKLGPSGMTRGVVLYYLTHRKKMQVCRQFFLKTLDVSEKITRIVLGKKLRGEFGNIVDSQPVEVPRVKTSVRSNRVLTNKKHSDFEY